MLAVKLVNTLTFFRLGFIGCAPKRSFATGSPRPASQRKIQYRHEYSYAHGATSVPFSNLTLGQLLQQSATQYADREAVVFRHQNIRKNFAQLLDDVDRVAGGLLHLKLQRGDRVGIWAPNVYEYFVSQYAAVRAGLIATHINPAYKSGELAYALNKVEVKALIATETFRQQDCFDVLCGAVPELQSAAEGISISSKTVPSLKNIVMISDQQRRGTLRFTELMQLGSSDDIARVHNMQRKIQADDRAFVIYTSGTTGNPKAAVQTHHGLVNVGQSVGRRMGYHKEVHRLCLQLPLFHSFAAIIGTVTALFHGVCCVSPSPVFSARESMKAIHNEKCTSVYGTPTMFVDMLNLPERKEYDVSHLKTGVIGGAPVPEELVNACVNELNLKDLLVAYGMTETSGAATANFRGDPNSVRFTTIGFPLDHVEAKVVNKEGETVRVNEPGELLMRGFNIIPEYWGDEKKTEETITPSKWLRSGDVAIMDEFGYLRIVGRIKDMLIRGGENVYPAEIEDVLHTHPSVAEAQVVGVPDKRLGEEVCAWVRPKLNCTLDEKDLQEFCKARMAYFKVPRYWHITDEFPRTSNGKVKKYVMRELSIKELEL